VLASADHSLAGTLVLHPDAVVLADNIRVADLCRMEEFTTSESAALADIVIAPAPEVGVASVVTSTDLRKALQSSGANLATLVIKGASSCDISRPRREEPVETPSPSARLASQHAGAKQVRPGSQTLRSAIEAFLTTDVGVPEARVNVQYGRTDASALDLTSPPYTFEIRRTSGRRMGLVGLEVGVSDASSTQQNLSVNRPAVVAARAINQGAVIGATDVQIVDMTFTRPDQLGMTNSDAVVGQRAKRFIPSGQVVDAGDLESVPLVKRGQIVNVESHVGGVSIISVATAVGGGAYGEVVTLRAGDRGKHEFSAMIIGPGRVRLDASIPATDSATGLAMGGTP
jgi:flagella basal body P-ring formation protein FlgA